MLPEGEKGEDEAEPEDAYQGPGTADPGERACYFVVDGGPEGAGPGIKR